jgi:hypothetical protein
MKVYIACLTTFTAVAMLACGSDRGPDGVGSSEERLVRKGVLTDPGAVYVDDAGTKDTGDRFNTKLPVGDLAAVDSPTGPTSCAPQRWDLVAEGRTCFDFAGRVSNGLWTVAPIFPDGPPSLRNTHCALTFIPDAPGCARVPAYEAFHLSCSELRSLTERSAACAANPAACSVSATSDTSEAIPFKAQDDCSVPDTGPDSSGGGYIGGCGACGAVYGNTLYITNPFNSYSTIATTVTKSDGTTQQLQFSGVGSSSFSVPLSGSYTSGTVPIWR